jgi:hypothetical protein
MHDLKLVFPFEIHTDLRIDDSRFVAGFKPDDGRYVTYAVDSEGNCYWGHYGIATIALANADLIRRSRLIYDLNSTIALEATNNRKEA